MPQDPFGNYQYPEGTRGVPDTTIESDKYNDFIDDLRDNDLNIARPVHRGGTSAVNADGALINLSAEKAAQLVTNYDSHVWMPGSFRSAADATGAPVTGHAFAGIAYIGEPLVNPPTNANAVILARDRDDTTKPGRMYIREKKANVWGVWKGEDRVVVSSTPPVLANTPDGALWWDSDNGVLYVNYNDGDTTQWVQAVALPAVDTSLFATAEDLDAAVASANADLATKVAKTGDTMTGLLTLSGDPTADLHAVPKRWAAPLDAMAYSGMQFNGSADVSQEFGYTGRTTSGYFCDGWWLTKAGTGSVTAAAQFSGTFFPGLLNYFAMSVQTGQASMAAGDVICLLHKIEAVRTSRLAWGTVNARPITIAFWSVHNRTGLYSGSVNNGAVNRSYAFTYTQAVADTPQYNIITIPGDTAGTWNTDNTVGLILNFAVACGATYTASVANTWLAGNFVAAPGQINAAAATSDFIRIAGVIVLPGIYAPTAAQSPLIMRPYDQELVTCQRYYYKRVYPVVNTWMAVIHAFTSTLASGPLLEFPVQMRAAPTVSAVGSFGLLTAAGAPVAISGGSIVTTRDLAYLSSISLGSASLVAGNATVFHNMSADSSHAFDARL